jgi:hypothetical protein
MTKYESECTGVRFKISRIELLVTVIRFGEGMKAKK